MYESEWCGVEAIWGNLDELFDDILSVGSRKCVPIRLKTSVERDEVIADAANQMLAIADRILAILPD